VNEATSASLLRGCVFYICFDFEIATRALLLGTENFKAIF